MNLIYINRKGVKHKDAGLSAVIRNTACQQYGSSLSLFAFHFGADPDQDPDPTFQFDADPCGSGSATLLVSRLLYLFFQPGQLRRVSLICGICLMQDF
jgi:hypothetical protein